MERLTYVMMGLEALYLAESSELSHRLAQRVAKIMGFLGFNSQEVYKEIKEAYGIRSKFIHGASFKEKEIYRAGDLVDKIIRYLQISILTFLELGHAANKGKQEILELLDASMISPALQEELEDMISKSCQVTLMVSRQKA